MEFKGKIAVVTGGSSGIGRQLSHDLASLGCKVIIVGRDKDKLRKVRDELTRSKIDLKVEVMAISCDVSSHEQVEQMAKQVIDKFGKIDFLINSAGYGSFKSIEECSIEEYTAMMGTNYFGTLYCIKSFLPIMKKQGSGVIVNISSLAGMMGIPRFSAYCATKYAVLGLSESLNNELEGTGISTIVICPSKVDTSFFDDESFKDFKKVKQKTLSPVKVSSIIIRAMKQNKAVVLIPKYARALVIVKSFMPSLVNKVLRRYKN